MTTIEQELQAELGRLRAAVDYIEEANQRTAEALAAASTTQAENQRLHSELQALQQRLAALEASSMSISLPNPLITLAAVGCMLLVGGSSWLWRKQV